MSAQILLPVLGIIAFVAIAPLIGGLIAGFDRKISARMQGRVGPPLLQPFYDVAKLFSKADGTVSPAQDVYMVMYLAFVIISGCLFFAGGDFLLVILLITMASLFLIMAAYNSRSPYAEQGAQREALQVMSYEPMTLITAAGFYLACGTFSVSEIVQASTYPQILKLLPIFIGFLTVLTIKLRKSPFDLSTSEHAHQEIVKGVTTELSGKNLAYFEIAHWYETVLFCGWTGLFILWNSLAGLITAIVVVALLYLLEIWIDNNFARVKWEAMLKVSWVSALVLGGVNLVLLYIGFLA